MIDRVTGTARKVTKEVQDMGRGWERTTQTVERFNKGIQTSNQQIVTNTQNLRRFKFEWLSVMFAGMALSRVFGGLIRAQFQLFGISDLLSSMWTVIMLPVMMAILPIILKLTEFFMNLPEGVKLAIGIFIILAAIFGVILLVVGQVMLAIGGIAIIFTVTAGVAAAAMGAIVLAVIAVIAVVVLVVVAIKKNWFSLWDFIKFTTLGSIMFIGDVIMSVFKVFKFVFWDGPKALITSLWGFIKNIFGKIGGLVSNSFIGKAFNFAGGLLGSFQTGGVVPQTGPYLLHQGETVVPTNQGAGGLGGPINITVNANVASDYDVRRIADELKRRWVNDFERLSQGRGGV
jgi:hypothetical protein